MNKPSHQQGVTVSQLKNADQIQYRLFPGEVTIVNGHGQTIIHDNPKELESKLKMVEPKTAVSL